VNNPKASPRCSKHGTTMKAHPSSTYPILVGGLRKRGLP
jgi:hypothetical protein